MKRRTFLKSTAATAATVSAMTLDAKTYAQAPGANEAIGIAFLGVGGRCQQRNQGTHERRRVRLGEVALQRVVVVPFPDEDVAVVLLEAAGAA